MTLGTEPESSGDRPATAMIVLGVLGLVAPVLTFFLAVSSFAVIHRRIDDLIEYSFALLCLGLDPEVWTHFVT